MSWLRPACACALGLVAACGAAQPQGPYYGDERYLVLGVQPDAEAVVLAQQLEASGFPLIARVGGQNFTALGFGDAEGVPLKVRVVTARGIELALDPETNDLFREGVSYALLDAPFTETRDADGDGFEEVFVEMRPASGEPPCIRVYRVRDSGFVDRVEDSNYTLAKPAESQADAWRDPSFCASEKPEGEEERAPPSETSAGTAQATHGQE